MHRQGRGHSSHEFAGGFRAFPDSSLLRLYNLSMINTRVRRWTGWLKARLAGLSQIDRSDREGLGGTASITLRQPLLLVVLVIVLLWYLARPSDYAAMSVTALGGMLGFSYWWARRLALGLTARRQLTYAAVQVGDEIEERVRLLNHSILPALWAEFADESNIPDYTLTSVRAVDGHSSLDWRAHAICMRRGNYRFGPWELLTGDPLGLFRVRISYDQKEEILVYPPMAVLPEQIIPRGRAQGDDRPLHQPLRAESLSAFTSRPYLPGDPLRHIHWPTTARHEAPFVKVFDPEASSTLWLIPDLDSAVQRGSGPDSTVETSIILLASLADRLLNERLAIGMIAFTDVPQVVLPARGRPHLWMLLRLLAGLETTSRPLSETLSQARSVISGRERVLVVTPSLKPEWAGELQRLGGANRRSGAEVILLDPDSFADEGPEPAARSAGGLASAEAYLGLLASLGVPARVLRRGDLRPQAGAYGDLSRWDFLTLGTGRAYARHKPRKFAVRLGDAARQTGTRTE